MLRLWEQDTFKYKGFTIYNHDGPARSYDNHHETYTTYAIGYKEEKHSEPAMKALEETILGLCLAASNHKVEGMAVQVQDVHISWRMKPILYAGIDFKEEAAHASARLTVRNEYMYSLPTPDEKRAA